MSNDHPDRADVDPSAAASAQPPGDSSGGGTPRWVQGVAIAAIAVVLLVLLLMATGGHGPGRHGQGLSPTGGTQPATVTDR